VSTPRSILIKSGTIVTATDQYVGDVLVEGERITTIGTALTMEADRVIDYLAGMTDRFAIRAWTERFVPQGLAL